MTPTYDWICKYCGSSNTAGKPNCASCLRLAWASPKEVDEVAGGTAPADSETERFEPPESSVLRALWYLCVAVGIVGALLAKLAPPIWLNMIGFGLVGVGVGGAWLISRIDARGYDIARNRMKVAKPANS
jgi:hypothetical protein